MGNHSALHGRQRELEHTTRASALSLRRSNLMQPRSTSSSSGGLNITSRGFQFLLEDVNTQLWDLLLQYLDMAEERNMDLVEVLAFLFMLGSLELGRDYSTEELPETQLHMLEDFRDYGLVYQRKASSRRFYPTRLATTLTSSAAIPLLSSNGTEQEERGYIILETNYRLYAYTPTHFVLRFCRCLSRSKRGSLTSLLGRSRVIQSNRRWQTVSRRNRSSRT